MAPLHPEHELEDFAVDEDGELDFSDLERQYAVPREEGFDQVIVVDNCPIVEDDARKDKLVAFIRKIFSTNGTIKPDGIYMPMKQNEETGKAQSQGYVPRLIYVVC
jgi:translation initiation factor 3 subunit B